MTTPPTPEQVAELIENTQISITPKCAMVFLEQAGKGCISGRVSEWPQLIPACRYAATAIAALHADNARLREAISDMERYAEEAADLVDDIEGAVRDFTVIHAKGVNALSHPTTPGDAREGASRD